MAQLFPPWANFAVRASLAGALVAGAGGGWLIAACVRSPYVTGAGVVRDQPVPFSHRHHAGALGIDCRYCHTSVEDGPFAGMPSTRTCMNCHRQIWADSPMLAPVRESERTGRPIAWTRVGDLADFTYFDHSIHVRKGVACATCHGPVEDMALMRPERAFFMEGCLECHRDPDRFVTSPDRVFPTAAAPASEPGAVPISRPARRTDCSTCHR